MNECKRRLEKQPCMKDPRSQFSFDAGFEAGWREALSWKCQVTPALPLVELLNRIQKIFIRARIGGPVFEELVAAIKVNEEEEKGDENG